jgi:hypothetical protein
MPERTPDRDYRRDRGVPVNPVAEILAGTGQISSALFEVS